jgi:hypothetical protein
MERYSFCFVADINARCELSDFETNAAVLKTIEYFVHATEHGIDTAKWINFDEGHDWSPCGDED